MEENPEAELDAKQIRFVEDQPSLKDKFGSHKRVADALYSVLTKHPKIKVIGLLGGWGSGKSSVVKQTIKLFHNSTNPDSEIDLNDLENGTIFFDYDTWLYQSDNPRRSFLEALIQQLVGQGVISEVDWEDDLESLAGRNEDSETTTTKTLTKSGKVALALTGLVPFGVAIVDFQLIKEAFGVVSTDTNQTLAIALLFTGLILVFAPPIGITYLWLKWLDWKEKKKDRIGQIFDRKHWKSRKKEFRNESVVSLITDRAVERTQHRTKISPEPTSIEFQQKLRKLMKELKDKDRRLICVIDNLDRLAPDEAVNMWSTMRSLFLGETKTQGDFSTPTIILPIDDSAIAKMFSATENGDSNRAISFSEKTFDLVFHVTEPIQSGWQEYLETQLTFAFGAIISDDEKFQIIQYAEEQYGTLDAKRREDSRSVTPRNLNKLVNSIAAISLTRNANDIGILPIAYYVIHKDEIDSDLIKFVSSEQPIIERRVEDWQRDIAAIHHGVETDIAFQVVLDEPLRVAIRDNDFENFEKLSKSPGFWSVLNMEINRIGNNEEGVNASIVRNGVILLDKIQSADQIPSLEASTILIDRYPKSKQSNGYPDNAVEFAKIAVRKSRTQKGPILAWVAHHMALQVSEKTGNEEKLKSFISDAKAIINVADSYDLTPPLFSMNEELNVLFDIINLESSESFCSQLNTNKKPEDVVTAIQNDLKDEKRCSKVSKVMKAFSGNNSTIPKIKGKDAKFSWNPLIDFALNQLQSHNASHFAAEPSVDVLGLLYNQNSHAKQQTHAFFDGGHFQNRLNETDKEQSVEKLADLSALRLLKGDDFQGPNGKNWEAILSEYPKFVDSIRNSLAWYQKIVDFDFLCSAVEKSQSFRGVTQAILNETLAKSGHYRITTLTFLNNFKKFESYLTEDNFERLLEAMLARENFLEQFEKVEFSSSRDDLAKKICVLDREKQPQIVKSYIDYLKSLNQDDWLSSIKEGDYNFDLSVNFKEDFGQSLTLTGSLPNALDGLLSNVSGTDEKGLRERWFALSLLVSTATRATKYKKIRDKIFGGVDIPNKLQLFQIGADKLWKAGNFTEVPDKCAIYIIDPFLRIENGRNWISNRTSEIKLLIEKSEKATKQSLNEVISDARDKVAEENMAKIEELGAELGLQLRHRKVKKQTPPEDGS